MNHQTTDSVSLRVSSPGRDMSTHWTMTKSFYVAVSLEIQNGAMGLWFLRVKILSS